MKESSKWRSCRAVERVARTRPSTRGGKMPQALAGHERIGAEDDGDVVMPAAEGAALVVVEPELSFEVFVDALGAPAFLGNAHELLSTGEGRNPKADPMAKRTPVIPGPTHLSRPVRFVTPCRPNW